MIKENLAKALKRVKKERRLPLVKLAEELGVEIPVLKSYMDGTEDITADTLETIVNKLHIPMQDVTVPAQTVNEVIMLHSGTTFPVCPQCHCSMEREYQSFCDRCGQRLNWKGFRNASVTKIGLKGERKN